jgi:hypothetical protein
MWIHWVLRVGVAACFVGHGAFGIITKADWLPYLAVAGIPEWLAWRLMPLVGTVDVAVGLLVLIFPVRAVLVWMVIWATWTALCRPLAGQGMWEFVERAGNFGVPLALLYMAGWGRSAATWFRAKASPGLLRQVESERLAWLLRLTTVGLLVGHGAFGVFLQKPQAWTKYFGVLGISGSTVQSASLIPLVGWFEILLALVVLARPTWRLLLFVFTWKLATELLRLPAGEPIWEVVERGGSYAAPLALFVLLRWPVGKTRVIADDKRHDDPTELVGRLKLAA